jgi:hypothetical protein
MELFVSYNNHSYNSSAINKQSSQAPLSNMSSESSTPQLLGHARSTNSVHRC